MTDRDLRQDVVASCEQVSKQSSSPHLTHLIPCFLMPLIVTFVSEPSYLPSHFCSEALSITVDRPFEFSHLDIYFFKK